VAFHSLDSPFVIRAIFKNIGKSAALHVKTCIASEFLPREQTPTFKCLGGPYKAKFIYLGTFFPGSSVFSDLVQPTKMDQEVRQKILSGAWNVWCYGRVEYDDVFGIPHWFNYCTHLLAGGGYAICDKHTDSDPN
jgi:hypothetical protein